jgi:hypothetical protein
MNGPMTRFFPSGIDITALREVPRLVPVCR